MAFQLIEDGDIFASQCSWLVNPVNVYPGCMGALAGAFARKFPGLEDAYKAQAGYGWTRIGRVVPYVPPAGHPRVLNFPTVTRPGEGSELAYIDRGLDTLRDMYAFAAEFPVATHAGPGCGDIAFPALGCGVGGLDWRDVAALVEEFAGHPAVADYRVEFYVPRS